MVDRMRILETVFYWAKVEPHRPALIQPEMVTDYEGLAAGIDSISNRIDQLGLDRQEPVAVSLANPSFFIATVFALWRSGYSAALVTPTHFPLLQASRIRNLIYDTQGQMLSGGRNIRFDMSWLPSANPKAARQPFQKQSNADGDLICFTSGTTGLPKKIVQAKAALEELLKYPFTCAVGSHQKILILPGLPSTFGFNRVCEVLNVGKTACFAQGDEPALSLISTFGIELVIASASQALTLAEVRDKNPGYRVDSLKAILVGGGKITLQGIARIRAALCRNVISQYGSTEGGVVALAPFDRIESVLDAIGFVMPWCDVQIVDELGQPVPEGAEGLIRYRTPQLMENVRMAGLPNVRDGWFYPGDIGSLTTEGILCIAGRSSDVINRGGVKVSGLKIEEILQALPNIKDAAACGITGASGLEELWIAVVSNGAVNIEEIRRLLREHKDVRIAPDELFIVEHIPRGELGKVQKYRLKELMLECKRAA